MKDTVLTEENRNNHFTCMFCACQSGESLCNHHISQIHDGDDHLYFLYNHFCFCTLCRMGASAPPFLWSESAIHKEEKQAVRTDLNEYT